MKRSQTVTCYTKNHKLYVSFAALGSTFAGYNEHSAGDAIASGYEQGLDTTNVCAVPSIIVGQNDSSVAITYLQALPTGGQWKVRILYQPFPGAV